MFDAFMTSVVTPERPLYFHTDDRSLRRMFNNLTAIMGTQPTVMPFQVSTASLHEPTHSVLT